MHNSGHTNFYAMMCVTCLFDLICLNTQELSYQQRFGGLRHIPPIDVASSTDSVPGAEQPKSILKKSIDFVDKLSPLPES